MPVEGQASKKQSTFSCLTLSFVLLMISCEVSKQTSNYGIQYYNGGKYPVPQTVIVILAEIIKLVVTVVRARGMNE